MKVNIPKRLAPGRRPSSMFFFTSNRAINIIPRTKIVQVAPLACNRRYTQWPVGNRLGESRPSDSMAWFPPTVGLAFAFVVAAADCHTGPHYGGTTLGGVIRIVASSMTLAVAISKLVSCFPLPLRPSVNVFCLTDIVPAFAGTVAWLKQGGMDSVIH